MDLDWGQLVAERNEWVGYNFPTEVDGKPGLGSMFGVIEELGELVHAHLKEDQGIRGDPEEHQAAAKDAIGDLTVYLFGLMNYWSVIPNPADKFRPDAHSSLLALAHSVGLLADDYWYEVTYYAEEAVSEVVSYMKSYCNHRGWDYEEIVVQTWAGVRRRDWRKFPKDGLTQ